VYAGHHLLVFASTRNEGMPMVMMEAMCAGCAVIQTGSGGAFELAERASSPLFPKDHPFALSRLLSALEADRSRIADIALRGQQTVLRDFTFDQMMDKTCAALGTAVEHRRRRERHVPVTASHAVGCADERRLKAEPSHP
jgi:glycosyltransferase involved in cell wall biosynthesis